MERDESGVSIAVCGKSQYAFVEIGSYCLSSRMLILKINHNSLVKMASIDQYNQKTCEKKATECFGYIGTHILWVGVSACENWIAQVFDFDTKTGEFKELQKNRINHQELEPFKLHRLGDKFYYTGNLGKFMNLSKSFQ